MKIKFLHPTTARLPFRAGDEITVATMTAELQALLSARRIDGTPVCEVVKARSTYADVTADDEVAVTNRQRRAG